MRTVLKVLSSLALVGVLAAPVAYLAGRMDLPVVKNWMLASTLLWFATVPFWMDRRAD